MLSTSGRRGKFYGDDSSRSTGDLGDFTGIEAQSGKNMCQGDKPEPVKLHSSYIIGMNVCGPACTLTFSLQTLEISGHTC